MPGPAARQQILEIHLQRRKQNPEKFDLAELAARCDQFSGSEIEQAVVSALFSAFEQETEMTTKHILSAMAETRPLAVLTAEKVAQLRAWANNRCVSAD